MRHHYESRDAVDGCAHECALHKNGLRRLPSASADLALLAKDGAFIISTVVAPSGPTGGVGYYVEGGAFYDATKRPDETKLTAGLKFAKKTATVMTYEQYFLREEVCTACATPLQKPFVYLCIPRRDTSSTPRPFCHRPRRQRFSSRACRVAPECHQRPLTRMPDEEIIYRFQLSRVCRPGLTPRP